MLHALGMVDLSWFHKEILSEHLSNGREVWGPAPGVLGQDSDQGEGAFGKAGGHRPQVPEWPALNTQKSTMEP